MSVNTSASWSVHALRMRLGMLSGLKALRGLTHLNVLLTLATEKESQQSLVECRAGGTVLSSKWAKKGFSLSGWKTSCVRDVAGLPFVIRDCLLDPATCVSCLFDCQVEGMITLFVFCHIPSRLVWLNAVVCAFRFA